MAGDKLVHVESLRIDEEGRYLIAFSLPTQLPEFALAKISARLEQLEGELHAWWASGAKFKLLAFDENLHIALERVDPPSEQG